MSALKYRMVGQPPAPGLKLTPCRSLIGFSDRLTSPKTTSLLSLNAERAAPHPDDCLTHQPQPSLAIQRTIAVLPAAIASFTKLSNVESVSFRYWAPFVRSGYAPPAFALFSASASAVARRRAISLPYPAHQRFQPQQVSSQP